MTVPVSFCFACEAPELSLLHGKRTNMLIIVIIVSSPYQIYVLLGNKFYA